jgi:SCY1-like protein 1
MNYLKSITTSVLNSTGVTFPFSIGERIPGLDAQSSIWEIREGVKKVRLPRALQRRANDIAG